MLLRHRFPPVQQTQSWMKHVDEGTSQTKEWFLSVDIIEKSAVFEIHADVPGVLPENLSVVVEDNTLKITANREPSYLCDEGELKWKERRWGEFSREFTLPSTCDASNVEAHFDKGVLTVLIPKLKQTRQQTVPIRIK